MNSDYILQHADALVKRVSKLIVNEPAARAALRRGVGLAPEDPRMLAAHRVVAPYVPVPTDYDVDRRRAASLWDVHAVERAFYAVAAIMAAQPRSARDQEAEATEEQTGEPQDSEALTEPTPAEESSATKDGKPDRRPNLGVSLAQAVFDKGLNADSTEQRLHLIARQNLDGVHRHLPRLVLYLRSDQVHIDWGILIRDLARWGHTPRHVAREWVQNYHRTLETLTRQAEQKNKNNTTDEEAEAA